MKDQREERKRARGVLLYLEEQVNEKISNFESFPEGDPAGLDKYIVFNTKFCKRGAYPAHAFPAG